MANVHRQHIIVYQGSDFDSENLTLQFWESIQLREDAAASTGATTLKVYDTPFQIAANTVLQFPDGIAPVVSSLTAQGSSAIAINSLASSLSAEAIARVRKLDLTGYTGRAKIRKKFADAESIAEFVVTFPSPTTDGKVVLELSATTTAALDSNCTFPDISEDLIANLQDEALWTSKLKAVAYVWDLELISPGGKVKRRAEGWVLVPREATR